MSDDSNPTDPDQNDRAADEAADGGPVVLYFWGSLVVFGAFLVAVPGQRAAGRTWLWVGVALLVGAVSGLTVAVRARLRHPREDGRP